MTGCNHHSFLSATLVFFQAEKGMADLPVNSSSLVMARIRGDLSAADAWDLLANSSPIFAGQRLDRETADLDRHLQDIFDLDDFNEKCFPELPEAWCPSSTGQQR